MIRCLVFDFDGVLVDSNTVKRDAYFRVFAPLGNTREVVEECLTARPDANRYQVIGCILHRLEGDGLLGSGSCTTELIVHYAEQYNDICEAYTVTCPEIPGVSECLPRLAQHYALYINSATPEEPLRRVVHKRQWNCYFHGVVGSPRTKIENLAWILQRENVEGSRVIFVGDRQWDLIAARACGCHFVGIRSAYNHFDVQDLVILDDLRGLEKVIRQMGKATSYV
jgi:phosphoglycolate phosphatase-like HAD superfamily hydrolase